MVPAAATRTAVAAAGARTTRTIGIERTAAAGLAARTRTTRATLVAVPAIGIETARIGVVGREAGRIAGMTGVHGAFVRLVHPIDWEAPDGQPVEAIMPAE